MNTTDIRIAFKIDTGNDALWAKTHDGKDMDGTSSLRGYPKSIYGAWLEEKIGRPRNLREKYFRVKKEAPTSNFYKPGGKEVFYENYIEWLETSILLFNIKIQ